ncbi:hypothetical protein HELRODRAFT_165575 [Helobdella robusta]|uniref:Uncharacterized protein n=1 Tax=Helobdella robusta TaxID=6412 RepID=T1EX10_HELRO|nr:hypothetical protein HELRODRAFT_165575 [Helobdella robusta]ESN91525.1 hypothetical protein HELRODRAFT_165575 [Helobdella robusta]
MVARSYVVNELLYFLINNSNMLENDCLKMILNANDMLEKCPIFPLLSQPEENFAAKNKVNTKAPNNINNENVTQKAKSHNVNDKVVKTENWADDLDTPTDKSMQPFTLVEKRKRLNKFPGILYETQDSDSVQPLKYSEVAKKTKSKIIGNKVNNECKLKAEKIIVKKSFFMMSNVKKCHRNDVAEYLTENGIRVISCFPIFNKTEAENKGKENKIDESSTMFRVCVEKSDVVKMKDPDVIPQHIIVREWQFNPKISEKVVSNNDV